MLLLPAVYFCVVIRSMPLCSCTSTCHHLSSLLRFTHLTLLLTHMSPSYLIPSLTNLSPLPYHIPLRQHPSSPICLPLYIPLTQSSSSPTYSPSASHLSLTHSYPERIQIEECQSYHGGGRESVFGSRSHPPCFLCSLYLTST